MPIHRFDPVDTDHPDWQSSSYVGSCLVHAPSEFRAREMLNRYFDARGENAWADLGEARTPWLDPDRARCKPYLMAEDREYREGLILIRRSESAAAAARSDLGSAQLVEEGDDGPWVPVNADRLVPKTGAGYYGAPGTAYGRAGQTGDEEPAQPVTQIRKVPVTRATVERVVQNRIILDSYSLILMRLLGDLLGPEGLSPGERNVSLVDTLGLPEDADPEELMAQLRELRDEVRLFREALERAADAPEATMSPTTLERLRDIGIKHLDALATNKVFVSTVGASLGCTLWSLLERAGLIDMSKAEALLKIIIDAAK